MTDLHDRFRSLDRTVAPDLWSEVERRAERTASTGVRPVVGRLTRRGADAGSRSISLWRPLLIAAAVLLALAIALVASQRSSARPLVFVSRSQVFAVDVPRGVVTPIFQQPTPAGRELRIAPDGRHVAFLWSREGGDQLVIGNADGSGQLTIGPVGVLSGTAEWSPNGQTFAWIGHDETAATKSLPDLIIVGVDEGGRQRIKLPPVSGELGVVWSPDNRHLALLMNETNTCPRFGPPRLYLVDIVNATVQEVGDQLRVGSLAWSRDGRGLVASIVAGDSGESGSNCDHPTAPSKLVFIDAASGTLDVLVEGLRGPVATVTWWADDRSILYAVDGNDETGRETFAIWRIDLGGHQARPLATVQADATPAWSPDLTQLAFLSSDDLFVLNLPEGRSRRLASGTTSQPGAWPKWSPDGSWIAFLREGPSPEPQPPDTRLPNDVPQQVSSLWVIRPDGTHEQLLVDDSFGLDAESVDW